MRTYEVPVGPDGAVVIPAEVRGLLSLSEGRRVRFTVDGSGVRMSVVRSPYTVEDVLGSLPGKPGLSADLDDEIEEAIGDALADKYGVPAHR